MKATNHKLNDFAAVLARAGQSVSPKHIEQVRSRFALLGYELNATAAGFEVKNHCRRAVVADWRHVEVILEEAAK